MVEIYARLTGKTNFLKLLLTPIGLPPGVDLRRSRKNKLIETRYNI